MVVLQLVVHVVPHLDLAPGVVLLLKIHLGAVGVRNHPLAQFQREQRNETGRYQVGQGKAVVADTAGEDGDDLRILRHLGRKENDRKEHEHRGIHVHEIRDEVEVVVKDDFLQGGFLLDEVVNLLAYVEDDHHHGQYRDGNEESGQELADDVPVQLL